MKPLKVYVAGKVSKESHFGRHDWRDEFVEQLAEQSGRPLINVDPTKSNVRQNDPSMVFGADAYMIKNSDLVIVYLSDDISIGGSQEILIAKYFTKPVIGLAPQGGKFNGATKEYFGEIVHDYKDGFVFSTCDVVCATEGEVAEAVRNIDSITPKDIDIIKSLSTTYEHEHAADNSYLRELFN